MSILVYGWRRRLSDVQIFQNDHVAYGCNGEITVDDANIADNTLM